jgi:hypothetical protein
MSVSRNVFAGRLCCAPVRVGVERPSCRPALPSEDDEPADAFSMKTLPATFPSFRHYVSLLFILSFLVLVQGAKAAGEITYDAQDKLPVARLDGLIDTYNNMIESYNAHIQEIGYPAESLASQKERIDELKGMITELKRRVESAKASRGEFPSPAQVPWGSAPKQVAELMTKRGAKLTEQSAAQSEFSGGEFAGEAAHRWAFKFFNDQLYEVQIYFSSTAQSMELFRHWNEVIATKYMIADVAQKISHEKGFNALSGSFQKLNSDTASRNASAANAMVIGAWQPTARWNFGNGNRIDLVAATTDMVVIIYVNGAIKKAKDAAPKASSVKDL